MKIRKGDMVKVISGREKGKTGKVLKVYPDRGRVLVEHLNIVKRHQKPSQTHRQGGIIEKEVPIQVSNVMFYDEKAAKATRLGYKVQDGKKVRFGKLTGETIATLNK